jgi:hypothetical protein
VSLANNIVNVIGVRGQLHTDKTPSHVADDKLWFDDGSSYDLTELPTDDNSVRMVRPGEEGYIMLGERPVGRKIINFTASGVVVASLGGDLSGS